MATIYTFEKETIPSCITEINHFPVIPKPSLGEGYFLRVDIPLLIKLDTPEVPIPPSAILLCSALIGLIAIKRFNRKK